MIAVYRVVWCDTSLFCDRKKKIYNVNMFMLFYLNPFSVILCGNGGDSNDVTLMSSKTCY